MRNILRKILREFARTIISIYKPHVIAITGSVGKTSTKQAIAAVLTDTSGQGQIRVAQGSFNTDWGVPVTIIGGEYPGGSLWRWCVLIVRAIRLIVWRDPQYPSTLVLEMGADRRGDIHRLVTMAPPTVGVVTAISPAHLEHFGTIETIAREKLRLLQALPKHGAAIVGGDIVRAWTVSEWTHAPITTVGDNETDGVWYSDVHYRASSINNQARGTSFKLHWRGSVIPCFLIDVVGEAVVQAACFAAAVGIAEKVPLLDIAQRLSHTRFPTGRMHIVEAIRHSVVIDDTYNASPNAMRWALEVLEKLGKAEGRTSWAVLGDMAELGGQTEEFHRDIGRMVAQLRPARLVTVGSNARWIAIQAIESGYPVEQTHRTTDAWEAGRMVQQDMREGDLVLVKGSQVMRMERVVKEIMAHPLEAAITLVRQEWWWR